MADMLKIPRKELDPHGNGVQNDLKPFLFSLKVTGLHHLSWNGPRSQRLLRTMSAVYRGLVPSLLMSNFVISLGKFMNVREFDGAVLNNLICSIWFLQVTMFSVNNALICWRWDRIYEHLNRFRDDNKPACDINMRKIALVTVISFIVWLLVSSGFMTTSLSTHRPPSGFMAHFPEGFAVLMTSTIVVSYFYFISTWFLLTSQFAVACVTLFKLLKLHYHDVKKSIENHEYFGKKIEHLRQQHDKICTMIELADDILSVFVLVTVFTTIPLIVLTLYFVLFDTGANHTFSYVATWWSITLSTIQLAVVFLFRGCVNYMLSIFLNRLTSQSIGLTACGLFVLDKPTIMTFVGSIATYAIVMIQFKPADSQCAVVCNNCSSVL